MEFEHVWKKFRVGSTHNSLRDFLPAVARRLVGRRPEPKALGAHDFWALRDVSFEVRPGEALGIIGHNGSGKSTILKLLTRVLGPTRGRCGVTGRVGALIELASGFHSDLTGRENVHLQGRLMGMPRAEVVRKFEQIVEFAGVAAFIDTPVKRYSSGMTARLGFAIAAHLDPEVLIIDEVLSVGDASFQRKALARIAELVRREIPVVIVTHQLEQVTALCTKAIVLEQGDVVLSGAPGECVAGYLERSLHRRAPGSAAVFVKTMELPAGATARSGERLPVLLDVVTRDAARAHEYQVVLRVRGVTTGAEVFEAALEDGGTALPGRSEWVWLEASLQLNVPPGQYALEVAIRARLDGREVASGPVAYVDVAPSRPFEGQTQMNLACTVVQAEEYGPDRDYAPPPAEPLPTLAGGAE